MRAARLRPFLTDRSRILTQYASTNTKAINTMNIDQSTKLHKIAGSEGRFAMDAIHVNADKGCLEATNGKAFACVPFEGNGMPHGSLIPKTIFAEMLKGKANETRTLEIADGRVKATRGAATMEQALQDGTFPNCVAVLWDERDDDVCVTLDTKMLADLAAALGSQSLKLRVQLPTAPDRQVRSPIRVSATGYSEAYGAIMPIVNQ